MSVAEIKKRHDDQANDYLFCNLDRGELLDKLSAIEEILTEVENDWEPSLHPAAQELIERIRELTE